MDSLNSRTSTQCPCWGHLGSHLKAWRLGFGPRASEFRSWASEFVAWASKLGIQSSRMWSMVPRAPGLANESWSRLDVHPSDQKGEDYSGSTATWRSQREFKTNQFGVSRWGYTYIFLVFLEKSLASESLDMLATSAFVSLSGLLTAALLWPVILLLGAPGSQRKS